MSVTTNTLARACKLATDLREGSYDKVAAGKALAEIPDLHFYVDYNKFYALSLHKAVTKVCTDMNEPDLIDPVHFLLSQTWNETQDWCNRMLGEGAHK